MQTSPRNDLCGVLLPTCFQGEHRSSDKSLQRASGRLLAALRQGDSLQQRLAMPLLILLSQQRKLIVLQSQVCMLLLAA